MCRFVADGKPYPSTTFYQLLAGLLRYGRSKSADFVDKSDPRFRELRAACDNVARQLRKAGMGAEVKHAEVFTEKEELKLWETGTIGITNPLALVTAVFFLPRKDRMSAWRPRTARFKAVNLQPNIQSHD